MDEQQIATLVVVTENDAEIARAWPRLIPLARADQEVVLLLHRECAVVNATIEWVSDGTSFEGIGKMAPSFSVNAVVRFCAAISPKCLGLNVFATSGAYSKVIEKVPGAERATVVLTDVLLGFVQRHE